jgi:hypocretin (orexin) receptor 2
MFANNKTINMSFSPHSYSFNESSSDQIQLPNLFEYFLIFFGLCIFLIGIIGNLLVILVIVKNVHMRSITNIFIGNLAIGDFCVVLMCLPATLITDITGNWWFGKTMCKIIPYIQYISVCVSVLTLTSISYERYYAIVFPLKLKATKFRAKIIILLVWTLAVLINLPHPLVITLIEENGTF